MSHFLLLKKSDDLATLGSQSCLETWISLVGLQVDSTVHLLNTMVQSLEPGPTLPIWSWPGTSYLRDFGQVTFTSFPICEMGMITSSNLEVGWGLSKWICVKLSRECLVSSWHQVRLGIIIYLLVLVCTWVCHPWFRRWNFKNIVSEWGQEDPLWVWKPLSLGWEVKTRVTTWYTQADVHWPLRVQITALSASPLFLSLWKTAD